MKKFKNIAIIAHVDHGKTTLIDAVLKQAGVFRDNQNVAERVMDSNDLERERGITIFSKNAAFQYQGYKVNIVDTPGHADFGGEVQRIMKMVDSVLLLVDAFEGPMPQTKYVLKKSLEQGLRPIVVINKIDRPNARPDEVLNAVFDLFVELGADDKQLDFPVLYASAKDGVARYELHDKNKDLKPLFETILRHVTEPEGDRVNPFQFMASAISYDNYLGKIGTGRIHNGTVTQGEEVLLMKRNGDRKAYKITRIFTYDGISRVSVPEAVAGDIVSLAGIEDIDLGETVADIDQPLLLPAMDIDEPTLAMTFAVNDSPFAGTGGALRHLDPAARPPAPRDPEQRQPAPGGHRFQEGLPAQGARHPAAVHPDREHAPRGLRVPGLPARGDLQLRQRPALRAHGDGRHRRRRRLRRRGHRDAGAAQGRAAPPGPRLRRLHPPRIPHPGPRPDRRQQRLHDLHPRHGHPQPLLHGLRALQGRDEPQDQGGAGGASSPASRWPTDCSACRSAAACSSAPASRSTPA